MKLLGTGCLDWQGIDIEHVQVVSAVVLCYCGSVVAVHHGHESV